MNIRIIFGMLLVLSSFGCQKFSDEVKVIDPLIYVDPFIGTGFHGHTFPGATVPNGMVQLSPDTHLMGWDASSGFHYSDSIVYGFSHTHLSGTGIGDMGDVLLLPYSGTQIVKPIGSFKKNRQVAEPGYYSVYLDNFEVLVELTATCRVGMHRYTFSHADDRNVMLDLGHVLQPNWGHKMINNELEVINDHTVEGVQKTSGWAYDHHVAYRIEFSEPFQIEIVAYGKKIDGAVVKGKDVKVYFHFEKSDKPMLVKTALSPVNTEGASKNMDAELPGWEFEQVVTDAKKEWQKALIGIEIKTDDESVRTNFYTAMYHSMISPFTYQDVDGRYRGMNKKIIQAPNGYTNYTVFSLWDTFRAFHPLMTIFRPEKAVEWANSLVQKYREGGILPKWPLASNYTGTMVGYPAVSVMADVVAKGLYDGDLTEWVKASVTSATYQPELLEKFKGTGEAGIISKHVYFKETLGFVPCDSISESISYGLEMAYYDWCVAQIAKAADEKEIENEFLIKGLYFKKYFDKTTGLMRGVNADGSWRTPFRPRYSSHQKSDYVEGTAWQWSFFVPHALEELIALYGSADSFESQLDTLFTTTSVIEGESASGDITGLIGQYAHGNEPSHHMAYLYNWTNAPYKTQERIDQILYDFYKPTPEGIIGNEDCGQMSAWYVMSALGFYQVCPGDPTFTIGRPIIDYASITVPGGKFEIEVHNNSRDNKYVQKVLLNGTRLSEPFFSYDDIMKGGKLEFFMVNTPE